jgi:hypothetical protein
VKKKATKKPAAPAPLFDDGGPAYPHSITLQSDALVRGRPVPAGTTVTFQGMTALDVYAMQAMKVLAIVDQGEFNPIRDADVCFEVADAMLKARKRFIERGGK